MTPCTFLVCASVSVWTCPCAPILKSSQSPSGVLAGYEPWRGPKTVSSQHSRVNLLFTVPSCKANADLTVTVASCKANAGPRSQDQEHPLLKVLTYAFAFTLPTLIIQQAFPTFGLGGACICSQGRRQRLAHGTSTCTSTCVAHLPALSTCTSMCMALLMHFFVQFAWHFCVQVAWNC